MRGVLGSAVLLQYRSHRVCQRRFVAGAQVVGHARFTIPAMPLWTKTALQAKVGVTFLGVEAAEVVTAIVVFVPHSTASTERSSCQTHNSLQVVSSWHDHAWCVCFYHFTESSTFQHCIVRTSPDIIKNRHKKSKELIDEGVLTEECR